MEILIIGGTRNLGHLSAIHLLEAGHRVTVFNRGQTPDDLPNDVVRLRGDRNDPASLKQGLGHRSFGAVIDTTLYRGTEAKAIVELLQDRVGFYVFLSTGQVYLVRKDLKRPFREDAYQGPVMTAPPKDTYDYRNWVYGVEKREAEDVLAGAWENRRFPVVSLRLPMVNSQRDHYGRIYGYLLRLKDGGPILVPDGPKLPLRHVYAGDVVKAIRILIETGRGKGRAYNISQDETVSLEEFLNLLAKFAGSPFRMVPIERRVLEAHNLIPDCSPFSDPWMSELDNQRSKEELGLRYTPLSVYLRLLVSHYETQGLPAPSGYRRRKEELELASNF